MKIRLEMKNYNMILLERLQKISALSSGKTHEYGYLTGEDILPSNQQQIIEQAKFTYSPLEKASEKQTKTIEDQGNKQIDALADLKPKEIKPGETKPNKYGDYFLDRLAKIRESYKPTDFNDLTYNSKDSRITSVDFIKFKVPLHVFKSLHNGDKDIENIEKEQIEFKRDLGRIKQGDPRIRSEKQQNTIDNIENLYNSREEVIKLFSDYARNVSRNIYDSKQKRTGLEILIPKQILQRLPKTLAQIKADNSSQSLLNEIRQIVYSLYQSKEITKKVYNNILKSIKL